MPEMGTVGTSLSGAARFPKARTITRTSRPTMMAPTMMSGKYEPMFAAMPGACAALDEVGVLGLRGRSARAGRGTAQAGTTGSAWSP